MISHPSIQKTPSMSKSQRATFYSLISFGIILTTIFAGWWFWPSHIPTNFAGIAHIADFVAFGLLTYVIWYQIISEVFSWMVARDMKDVVPMETKPGYNVAFLTAFVPGKEPYDILEKTLRAMVETDYAHDTWLLDEGDDEIAKEICKRLGVKHFSRKGIAKYNLAHGPYKSKTKGGNHNSWHDKHGHNYEFVAQIDVDFMPRKDFLTKTLGYFRDEKVAFVGTPQIYGNLDESWIARGAAEQAYGFYGNIQKGFFGKDMQLFIGANHVVRTAALKDIGGYPGHIVEDHLTGMHLYSKRWTSVYVPEKLAIGEGPATWDAYFSQQMRWAYGLIDILLNHSPKLFPKMKFKHALNYYLLQQHYFYGVSQAIGIILMCLYFIFGIQSTTMQLVPLLSLYIPLILWQTVIALWLQKFNVDPETESGLLLRGKLLTLAAWPIYLLAFISVLTRKRLTYAVTPKGSQQTQSVPLTLFLPHLILGSASAIGLIYAISENHFAPLLVFWGAVNTVTMYGFILYIFAARIRERVLPNAPRKLIEEPVI
jgi:cellulose synthase (UDP-forming)